MSNQHPEYYGLCPDCERPTVVWMGEMSEQEPVTQEWRTVDCWECESCGLAFNDFRDLRS